METGTDPAWWEGRTAAELLTATELLQQRRDRDRAEHP